MNDQIIAGAGRVMASATALRGAAIGLVNEVARPFSVEGKARGIVESARRHCAETLAALDALAGALGDKP